MQILWDYDHILKHALSNLYFIEIINFIEIASSLIKKNTALLLKKDQLTVTLKRLRFNLRFLQKCIFKSEDETLLFCDF